MSRKFRRFLLLVCVLIFLLLGAGLVLYSGGARFDLKNWQLVQTGGIYLKTEPAEVQIALNGKAVKNRSGFLQSGTLIDNLKPGTYHLSVEASGDYFPWQKDVRVESSTVALLDGVILFPKKGQELVASPTDKFLLELQDREVSEGEFIKLGALFNRLKQAQLRQPGTLRVTKLLPYPYNERKFVLLAGKALYILDTEKNSVSQVAPKAVNFAFSNTDVVWFDDKSLQSFNLILRNQSTSALPGGLNPADWKSIEFSPSGETMAILRTDNSLLLLEPATGKVTDLGKNITHLAFSPDSKKIAFLNSEKLLNVYIIKDGAKKEQYFLEKAAGEWSLITRLVWHEDNNYLFLGDNLQNLYFVEVSEFPPLNIVRAAAEVRNFTYSHGDNALYWEDSRGIWRLKL